MEPQRPRSLLTGSRRTHRKVRTGCTICKSRKIKCDEKTPTCSQCLKHGVACDILKPEQPSNANASTSATELEHERGLSLDKLDIELMHHWTLSTCYTLGDGPMLCSFWRENIVQIGLRCDFVMRSILSVTALHLAYLDPPRKPALVERSVRHYDIALKQALEALHTGNREKNLEVEEDLFAFSVLTLYYLMSSAESFTEAFIPGPRDRIQQSPDWMVFFDGAARFALTPRIRNNHRSLLSPLMREIEGLFNHRQHLRPGTYLDHLRSRIENLNLDPSSPLICTYKHAIHELDQTIGTSIESPAANSIMHIFVWLHTVSENFIPLIRGANPPQEALVILNYACMIPSRLASRWWLENWFNRLRLRSFELLDEVHRTWLVEPRFHPRD
ncbi:hypothetical protein AAE478_009946 [Parahypoxylon ruwenzoriense]